MATELPKAFFSYSREDLEFTLHLAKDLKKAGANVWMDKLDIRPGQLWEREVEEAVNTCPRILVILSPASVNSANVMAEVSFALDEKKEVIPVLHRDCKIPLRLRPIQYVDFRNDYSQGLQELLNTVCVEKAPERTASAHPSRIIGAESDVSDAAVRERETNRVTQKEGGRAAEQSRLEDEIKQAAEQARLEKERKRAAENARLEKERKQVAENARLEKERKQVAENARLEKERKQEAERARLEKETKQAAERARLAEEDKRTALDALKHRNKVIFYIALFVMVGIFVLFTGMQKSFSYYFFFAGFGSLVLILWVLVKWLKVDE
jgi:hypothetical protein